MRDFTVDNKKVLDSKDDVARVTLGGKWRMPSVEEWTELKENCTWTWTKQGRANGYKVTSKKNGKSIFLPATGVRGLGCKHSDGEDGYYWSSSLVEQSPDRAYHFSFNSDKAGRHNCGRCYGLCVRPVSE